MTCWRSLLGLRFCPAGPSPFPSQKCGCSPAPACETSQLTYLMFLHIPISINAFILIQNPDKIQAIRKLSLVGFFEWQRPSLVVQAIILFADCCYLEAQLFQIVTFADSCCYLEIVFDGHISTCSTAASLQKLKRDIHRSWVILMIMVNIVILQETTPSP